MQFPFRKTQPISSQNEKNCKIKIKKHSDGSITKEISKECTPAQIRALIQIDGKDNNIIEAED